MEHIPARVARRFWRKAQRQKRLPEIEGKSFSKPCLVWMGARDQEGYGIFKAFPGCMGLKSGIVRVHRMSFWLHRGPFPANAQIHHRCENTSCLEIEHLEIIGISEHAEESNLKRWAKRLSKEEEDAIIEELDEI